mgnify:CR=1 FL=1
MDYKVIRIIRRGFNGVFCFLEFRCSSRCPNSSTTQTYRLSNSIGLRFPTICWFCASNSGCLFWGPALRSSRVPACLSPQSNQQPGLSSGRWAATLDQSAYATLSRKLIPWDLSEIRSLPRLAFPIRVGEVFSREASRRRSQTSRLSSLWGLLVLAVCAWTVCPRDRCVVVRGCSNWSFTSSFTCPAAVSFSFLSGVWWLLSFCPSSTPLMCRNGSCLS